MGTAQIAELCQALDVHGRLRMDGRALILERSFQATDPAALLEKLAQRKPGEDLIVDRFATYWLVRFIRTFSLPPTPEQSIDKS